MFRVTEVYGSLSSRGETERKRAPRNFRFRKPRYGFSVSLSLYILSLAPVYDDCFTGARRVEGGRKGAAEPSPLPRIRIKIPPPALVFGPVGLDGVGNGRRTVGHAIEVGIGVPAYVLQSVLLVGDSQLELKRARHLLVKGLRGWLLFFVFCDTPVDSSVLNVFDGRGCVMGGMGVTVLSCCSRSGRHGRRAPGTGMVV